MDFISSAIKDVSFVGSSPVIFGVAGVVILYTLARKDLIHAVLVVLSLGSGLYSSILKNIFKEGRPTSFVADGFLPWEQLLKSEIYSFPSTHTVFYTAFFGYLFYLSFNLEGIDKVIRYSVRAFTVVMIVFVGLSRVLLGAHYIKDVVFGYLFGLIYLSVVIVIDKLTNSRSNFRHIDH